MKQLATVIVVALILCTPNAIAQSAPIQVPHAIAPPAVSCAPGAVAVWQRTPHFAIAKQSGIVMRVNEKSRLALEFLTSDPNAIVRGPLPPPVETELDSLLAQYSFQWDENKLYGSVEFREHEINSKYPKISEKAFRRAPFDTSFADTFHSTAIIDIGAPSWNPWITEMHVHVRPPRANPPSSMFFGRTNDEEAFRQIAGEAVACPTDNGWVARFAVAWLPFGSWMPATGSKAALKLIVPLTHSHDGYVFVAVVPIVLTDAPRTQAHQPIR